MMTQADNLSLSFYLWERPGRGWDLWDYPVSIEPPFVPFYFHYSPVLSDASVADDGRIPTPLSEFADSVKRFFKGNSDETSTLLLSETSHEVLPEPFEVDSELREIWITFPPEEKVRAEFAEHLLLNLGMAARPLSFEIVGLRDSVRLQLVCQESDLSYALQQFRAYFPEAGYEVKESSWQDLISPHQHAIVVDFGLSEEFMRPLRTFNTFDPDPLIGIIGALEELHKGEVGVVQIFFQSVENPWVESMIRAVMDYDGGSFFADAPEMLPLTREKVSSPLFTAVVRVIAQGASEKRSWEIARSIGGALAVLTKSNSNELIPLSNDGYANDIHLEDVIQRQSRRSGMILNSRELLNLVHIPSASVRSPKFRGLPRKTKSAPKTVERYSYVLGENVHQNRTIPVTLSTEQRLRHIHIIGSTGTGKSTLLLNLVAQDMKAGSGCAVFDPHGDLIDRLVELVPEERMQDVILFDPADTEIPVGFNILGARSEIEKTVLSSDLVALFRRFTTSWGDQMTAVLGNAVSAFVENPAGGTLLELRRFLLEDDFRKAYLRGVKDPEISYFWEKQFPMLKGHALSSILTRLDIFLRPKIVRHIVGQQKGIDCDEIINGRKILFVKLAQGLIGEENAYLLGSLLVSKMHQAIMARQAKGVEEREPFYLYIDEFQHFVTPSMASVLESGRKFSVGLAVSHQQLKQLIDEDEKLVNSLITNPVTRICFRLGDFDAERLQGGFSYFTAADLGNLGVGEAIVRVERNEYDFNLRTYATPIVANEDASKKRERIVKLTRERYARQNLGAETLIQVVEKEETAPPEVEIKRDAIALQRSLPKAVPKPRPSPPQRQAIVPSPSALEDTKALSQHRYLQTLVKKMAEQRGYKAMIEEPTPDGTGRVDVGLERNEKKIAVEISVTTDAEQELHNIEKCLRAGYDPVIVCSPVKKNLGAIRKLAGEKLSEKNQTKVRLFEPEELFLFLDEQLAQEANTEVRIKGYRVKVQYQPVTEEEKQRKRDALAKVVAQSIRKLKK